MSRTPYVAIGVFVIAGLALAITGIVMFGATDSLRPGRLMETYIDGSVQGIDVGSPVKHRGVRIGKIKEIGFVGDTYKVAPDNPAALRARRYVRLVLAIESGSSVDILSPSRLQESIASGLRIRMAAQGITGVMYLEMDYVNSSRIKDLPVYWTPINPYIPSSPSMISEISDAAQNVFHRLAQTDIEGVAQEFQSTLRAVREAVGQADVAGLSVGISNLVAEARATNRQIQSVLGNGQMQETLTNINATAASLRRISAAIERDFPPLSARVSHIADASEQVVTQLNGTLAKGGFDRTLDNLAESSQEINRAVHSDQRNLGAALDNLRQATQQLNDFIATIREKPSLLVRETSAAPEPLGDKP